MSENIGDPSGHPQNAPAATTPSVTAVEDDLLASLVDEFAARLRRGEQPQVEEYAERHPDLAERIRNVLQAVALVEHSRTIDIADGSERPGDIIGRYKLLEQIGEGGFGVVFMAEQQEPVRRKVALKVIKPGMDTRQVIARFEAERQALAVMDHSNIARVLDAGATPSGRPYFVMELVRGTPITTYCDENNLPIRARLELFATVCQAVQHAHTKGIIHRDIKPTNVLVTQQDGRPTVKVIDFGVAKAMGRQLTEKTLFTNFAQMIGTPLYMSPEQAEQSGVDIDTRSDIYSLGVLLYELLTGSTPVSAAQLKQAAFDEIRRIIREEEPQRPSARISSSQTLPAIAAHRHIEPARLSKLVRGELDWIVMKALEKDRTRRYETATGFASDVLRYLADEPVTACPPSALYRMRKFARRNKAGLAATAFVLCLLILLGGSVGWAVRDRAARQNRIRAQVESILTEVDRLEREQRWPQALATAQRAEAVFAGGEADAKTTLRVREQLKDLEFIDRLEQIRMQQATPVGQQSFDFARADRAYAQAFRDYGVDVDELAVEKSIERLMARPKSAMALAAALDDWFHARWKFRKDVADWQRLVAVARGIDPDPLRDKVRSIFGKPASKVGDELAELAESIDIRANHPTTLARIADAFKMLERADLAIRLQQDALLVYPGDFWLNLELAQALDEQKDFEGAVLHSSMALAIRPNRAVALNYLGNSLYDHGKLDKAVAVYRRAIEIDPRYALPYSNLSVILVDQGKLDEAIALCRTAIEIDPEYASAYCNLGRALGLQGNVDEAIAALRRSVEIDPKLISSHGSLGYFLERQGMLDEAIAAYRKEIELDPRQGYAYNNLSEILAEQGKTDEVIAVWRNAVEVDPKWAFAYNGLGNVLRDQDKLEEAIAAFQKAIELEPKNAVLRLDCARLNTATNFRDAAAADWVHAIELSEDDALWNSPRKIVGLELAGDAEAFRRVAALRPDITALWIGRGQYFALQSQWADAADNYAKAFASPTPEDESVFEYAGSLLLAGDKTGYAYLCEQLAKSSAEPHPSFVDFVLARSCGIGPAETIDPQQLVDWAAERLREDQQPWVLHVLGLAQYRAGKFALAIETLEQSNTGNWNELAKAQNWFLLALAHEGLDHRSESREWFERAKHAVEDARPASANQPVDVPVPDWIELQLLLREAETVFNSRGLKQVD